MGNGMLTNTELIDSLLLDLNSSVKYITSGNYIAWCQTVASMGQKLSNLKRGVQSDLESRDQTIEDLKQQLRDAGREVIDMDPEEYLNSMKEEAAE